MESCVGNMGAEKGEWVGIWRNGWSSPRLLTVHFRCQPKRRNGLDRSQPCCGGNLGMILMRRGVMVVSPSIPAHAHLVRRS